MINFDDNPFKWMRRVHIIAIITNSKTVHTGRVVKYRAHVSIE